MRKLQTREAESSSEAVAMDDYDDEIEKHADAVSANSAFTSWYALSADSDDAAHGILRGRHTYLSSLSSSSSLRSTCTRPDGKIIKATYGRKIITFRLPLASSFVDLEGNVTERLHELKDGTFRMKYKDDEGDWILITNDEDLQLCMASLRSVDPNTISMLVEPMQYSQRIWKKINPQTLHILFAIILVLVMLFWIIRFLFMTLGSPLAFALLGGICFYVCLFSPQSDHHHDRYSKHTHRSKKVFFYERVGSVKTYSSFCIPTASFNHQPLRNVLLSPFPSPPPASKCFVQNKMDFIHCQTKIPSKTLLNSGNST